MAEFEVGDLVVPASPHGIFIVMGVGPTTDQLSCLCLSSGPLGTVHTFFPKDVRWAWKPSYKGATAGAMSTSAVPDIGVVRYWHDPERLEHVAEFSRLNAEGETCAYLARKPTLPALLAAFPRVVDVVLLHTTGLPGVVQMREGEDPKPVPMREPLADVDAIRSGAMAMLEGIVGG